MVDMRRKGCDRLICFWLFQSLIFVWCYIIRTLIEIEPCERFGKTKKKSLFGAAVKNTKTFDLPALCFSFFNKLKRLETTALQL